MKKLFAVAFLILSYVQAFAFNMLQTVSVESAPPPPGAGAGNTITPYAGGDIGDPNAVPVNFIAPFLFITAVAFTFYILRKNKVKTV